METRKIFFIGIIEDERDKSTIVYIRELLNNFNYITIYINGRENIVYLNKDGITLAIIYMEPNEVGLFRTMGIEFDFLIHNFMKKQDYKKELLTNQFKDCRYYILNSDDENWTLLPLGTLNGIVITYGLNSKATLTISSYNINQNTHANICLQREITSLWGDRIEPFEFTVEIGSNNKDNIYPVLAASILNFILYDKKYLPESYKKIRI